MYIKGHEEPNVGNERDKRVAVILFSALLFRLGQVDGLIIMHTGTSVLQPTTNGMYVT